MKLVFLSDIHANYSALKVVFDHLERYCKDDYKIIHLGDIVDYGMRPNETISLFKTKYDKVIVNLRGNHEDSIINRNHNNFSSQRGIQANEYTKSILSHDSLTFIESFSEKPVVQQLFNIKLLCIHGSLKDIYWGKMSEEEMSKDIYQEYDYVISGHSHIPMLKETYFRTESGKNHKTVFINPGSIGQPRNLNPSSQYAVLDLTNFSIHFNAVPYDFGKEQVLYNGEIDDYYRYRLQVGL